MASSIEARDISRRRGAGAQLRRDEDPSKRAVTGGDALVKTLLDHGVDTAFGVPGESYLAVLEALRGAQDRLRFVVTRHESGATFAACAYGRLARKPGVAFVTRGPGATNGAIGIHTARQDSVPLLLFIGQVPSGQRGREAFQEIDYHRMLGPLTKAVFEPQTPQEVADAAAEAHAIAMDGRPGPVAVSLPEDVTEGAAGNEAPPEPRAPGTRPPAPEAMDDIARLLARARAPRRARGRDGGLRGCQRGARRLRRGLWLRRAQLLPPAGRGAVREPRLSGDARPGAPALPGEAAGRGGPGAGPRHPPRPRHHRRRPRDGGGALRHPCLPGCGRAGRRRRRHAGLCRHRAGS